MVMKSTNAYKRLRVHYIILYYIVGHLHISATRTDIPTPNSVKWHIL